ncbi:hypothetical protein [Microvirga puerhi]|uniref:EF-hand domain-containing protein n=1 Tax=Microvirga puerhi TaxID=2876078 RepID=A0ABS7VIG1_9HYPH|nr:hypothetical protein [Microvirga puerhi]MBZ6074847.1 hypothetical protein [Microvirga puerhi]
MTLFRPIRLAALVMVLVPFQVTAKEAPALPKSIRDASREQIAATLPAPILNALLNAKNRKQFVATTVEFARASAGKDSVLTETDAGKLPPDDPRAAQIHYYLSVPYLHDYYTPEKLGSRSVPRIPVREMGQVARAIWDKFDTNHDGVLTGDELAPLRDARGTLTSGQPPL